MENKPIDAKPTSNAAPDCLPLSTNPTSNAIPACLPLYFYEFATELKIQAKKELFEDVDSLEESLTKFRNLIGESSSSYSDEDLMIFLRAAKHNVPRAYTTLKKHNATFKKYDVLFKNFQFASLQKPVQSNCMCFLPKRDVDGCVIAVCFLEKWDLLNFAFADIIRVSIIGALDVLRCPITQITGLKLIVDFSALNVRKMASFPAWLIKFTAEAMQRTTPLRLKGYHIVNNGKFFNYIWAVFCPLLSKKLRQRVYFHGHDMKSLHKHISPAILPEELGGLAGPQDNREWNENLKRSEDYILAYIKRAISNSQTK